MKVTLKTIAQEVGLSITTVSRALKDCDDVKKPTKDLIVKTAKRLGYAPNIYGLSLRTGINYDVALLMPLCGKDEIDKNIGKLNFISGIISSFNGTPYHLTIIPLLQSDDPLEKVKYIVESDLAGSLILVNTTLQDKCVAFLNDIDFPFVTYGQTEMGIDHPYVDLDNYEIGYKAASYLFKNACKNIRFFITDLSRTCCCHRFYGARRAAMEYGFEFSEKNTIESSVIDKNTRKIVSDLVIKENPDGIFFSCDLGALTGITAIKDINPDLLDSIKMITCEASYLRVLYSHKLAAIRTDLDSVGKKIGEFVMKRNEGADVKDLQYVVNSVFIEEDASFSDTIINSKNSFK